MSDKTKNDEIKRDKNARLMHFFVEIGIIQQLSINKFNRLLPDGLYVSHFSVISHLARLGDGLTPVQIADSFQVTRPSMTNTLMALEKRALIKLKPNPADGRSKLVFLTKKGQDFLTKASELLAPELEKISKELNLDELFAIIPALEKIRKYLDNNRN